MQIRTVLVWTLTTGTNHASLTQEEKTIKGVMPLIDALFPGVNYYSITGFGSLMSQCLIPALQKRFPELLEIPEEAITPEAMTEVTEFLASDGYEWQDSTEWQTKFQKLLEAA